MYASITTYHRGELAIEVLPGESHAEAWAAVVMRRITPASNPRAAIRPAAARRPAVIAAGPAHGAVRRRSTRSPGTSRAERDRRGRGHAFRTPTAAPAGR